MVLRYFVCQSAVACGFSAGIDSRALSPKRQRREQLDINPEENREEANKKASSGVKRRRGVRRTILSLPAGPGGS